MLFRLRPNPVLIALILDGLPVEVWTSTSTVFIDPAMGSGQFVTEIERRLRAHGHSDENIRTRVFGLESQQMDVNIAVNMNGLVGTYRKDANYSAFLNGELERLLGKDYPMKFHVVIGNPPYDAPSGAKNRKLWRTFSQVCLALQPEYLAFVTPDNVVSETGINGKILRQQIKDAKYGFICATRHEERQFDAGVSTCHWIIKKDINDQIDPIIIKSNANAFQGKSIIDKINSSQDQRHKLHMHNGHVSRKSVHKTTGKFKIYFSGQQLFFTNLPVEGNGALKLVFPFSSSYHKQFITTDAVGMLNLVLPIESEDQGKRIMSYTLSKAMIFFARHFKKTSGFCPAVKSNRIPKLDDTRFWTDSDVYAHFNFTPAEIDLIETTVK